MRISKHNNKINFGLKIVDNEAYKKLFTFMTKKNKTIEEINDIFERIEDLHDDSISLEFLDFEERYVPVFGKSAYGKVRIFGTMKKGDSEQECNMDRTSEYSDILSSEYFLYNRVKYLLKCEQERIDITQND